MDFLTPSYHLYFLPAVVFLTIGIAGLGFIGRPINEL